MGPLSPFSQAHWLWARGHFKHRERGVRWAIEEQESLNYVEETQFGALPLLLPVQSVREKKRKHKNVNMWSNLLPTFIPKPERDHPNSKSFNFWSQNSTVGLDYTCYSNTQSNWWTAGLGPIHQTSSTWLTSCTDPCFSQTTFKIQDRPHELMSKISSLSFWRMFLLRRSVTEYRTVFWSLEDGATRSIAGLEIKDSFRAHDKQMASAQGNEMKVYFLVWSGLFGPH